MPTNCAWCNEPIKNPREIERGRETILVHPITEKPACALNWLEQERRLERAFIGTI